MKILFFGNFSVDYCSEVHYSKTLKNLGHEVIQMQEGEATYVQLIAAQNIDLFFWVHTHGWATKDIDRTLQHFKDNNIPIVAYHLDLYIGLKREPQMEEYVTMVEHFFTVDKLMAIMLNEHTQTKGYYLPPGVFKDECYIAEPNPNKYPHEIVFTGSRHYHVEWPYRKQLIEWLEKTYGDMFAQYGGGGLPVLRGHELNVLYSSAKIVIGDTLCIGFKYPYYFSDRLCEVPGRGGFMIFPDIRGIDSMYNIGKEMVTYKYGDFEELKEKIDYYLANNAERESIRIAGHNKTKNSHTYTNRLQKILETLKLVTL